MFVKRFAKNRLEYNSETYRPWSCWHVAVDVPDGVWDVRKYRVDAVWSVTLQMMIRTGSWQIRRSLSVHMVTCKITQEAISEKNKQKKSSSLQKNKQASFILLIYYYHFYIRNYRRFIGHSHGLLINITTALGLYEILVFKRIVFLFYHIMLTVGSDDVVLRPEVVESTVWWRHWRGVVVELETLTKLHPAAHSTLSQTGCLYCLWWLINDTYLLSLTAALPTGDREELNLLLKLKAADMKHHWDDADDDDDDK